MRSAPINPLLLLILVQAWARVKKHAPEGLTLDSGGDALLPGWPEQVPLSPALRAWLSPSLRAESLCLDDVAWTRSLTGPLLCPSGQPWTSPGSLASRWGKPQAPVLETIDEIRSCDPADKLAIGMRWSSDWAAALPGEVLGLVDRAHQQHVPVWMHVEFAGSDVALPEDVLRKSTQVGWSWWCPPPATASALPAWFQSYRSAWGFWLCAPTSDQWAWPWLDMVGRTLVQKMGGRATPRTWLGDARQKAAFGRLEADVWTRACEVLGGQEAAEALLAQALLRLVRDVPAAR